MAQAARKVTSVKTKVHTLVRETKILGNTGINLRDFASQQLNLLGPDAIDDIVLGTGLKRNTIEHFLDNPAGYDPKSSTIHRIFIYLGMGAIFTSVKIQKKHLNVPKSERLF